MELLPVANVKSIAYSIGWHCWRLAGHCPYSIDQKICSLPSTKFGFVELADLARIAEDGTKTEMAGVAVVVNFAEAAGAGFGDSRSSAAGSSGCLE